MEVEKVVQISPLIRRITAGNGSVFTGNVDNRSQPSSSQESQRQTNIVNEFISILNNSDTGIIASAAVDDSSTIIIRSTVVDQNISIDLSATNSNNDASHLLPITKQTDNNVDDSNSSLTLSQVINDPASSERELSLSLIHI